MLTVSVGSLITSVTTLHDQTLSLFKEVLGHWEFSHKRSMYKCEIFSEFVISLAFDIFVTLFFVVTLVGCSLS